MNDTIKDSEYQSYGEENVWYYITKIKGEAIIIPKICAIVPDYQPIMNDICLVNIPVTIAK